MDVKVLLQLFNKSMLRNEIKTFLEPKFFSIVKFNKLGFSTPLRVKVTCYLRCSGWYVQYYSIYSVFCQQK